MKLSQVSPFNNEDKRGLVRTSYLISADVSKNGFGSLKYACNVINQHVISRSISGVRSDFMLWINRDYIKAYAPTYKFGLHLGIIHLVRTKFSEKLTFTS